MAVSYVSKPYQSDPYVLPFDLNLFSKVMQYKQAKYDQGATAIQGEIDQMGSLDVLKSQDKDYVNSKIKNLVNGVNNLGGVDLSDTNIVNQIEGFGSDIYSDDKVLSAISNTKSVRQLQAGYEALKTNPKLTKMYSPVNEAYDNRAVEDYIKDPNVGAQYHGVSSPTPYVDYRANHLKAFQGLKGNLREKVTDKGLVYVTDTNEEITPERVSQMASDLLTPDERAQMKRDAWYTYKDVAPQEVVQKSLDFNNQKLERANQILGNYKANADAATADPIARQNYLNLAASQENQVKLLTAGSDAISKNGLQKFQSNPEEYMYNTYSNEYNRGLAERFAQSKNTTKVTPNTAEMFKQRQEQSHNQFQENLDFQKNKFSKEQEMKALELGLKYFIDPITGERKAVGGAGLTGTDVNTADLDKYKISDKTYKNENSNLEADKQKLFIDFMASVGRRDPTLANLVSTTTTGTGVTSQIKGIQGLIHDKSKGFQIEDLNIGVGYPETQRWQTQTGVTDDQVKFLKSIYTNYNAMANGEKVDFTKLPEGFEGLVENYQLINEKIRANNAKVAGVTAAASKAVGLKDDDVNFFNEYSNKKKAYDNYLVAASRSYNSPGMATPPDRDLLNYLNVNAARYNQVKELGDKANTEKEKLYQQVENRPVYQQRLFTENEPLVKTGAIQKLFLSNLARQGDVTGVGRGEAYPVKDVEVQSAGRAADGSDSYTLTANVTNKKGEATPMTVTLSGEQAKQIGFQTDPYSALNESVSLSGRSGDLIIRGGKDLVTKINVVKHNDDRNDQTSYVQILLPTNNPKQPYQYVDLPNTDGSTPSEAYAKAKELVKNFALLGGTLADLQQQILDAHYK